MDGRNLRDIESGIKVDIILKQDQHSGKLTRGVVKDILTKSARHPHGIKVRLIDGQVGRVKKIITQPGRAGTKRENNHESTKTRKN